MRMRSVARWIAIGVLAALAGCAAGPVSPLELGCEPPHSRFHPVPTRPVFESTMIAPAIFEMPLEPLTPAPQVPGSPAPQVPGSPAPQAPDLPPPAPTSGEPQLLPDVSSKPISFAAPAAAPESPERRDPPSSRRGWESP